MLQKIWLNGDFDRGRATLLDGRPVTILQAGRWNLLGGPDFRNARLKFGDGAEITGDVELHLEAADWAAHRHASDPAYAGVVLHVVLFPPEADHVTHGALGVIPVLALLPLLLHDLEEYAADEAVETLANRPASQIVERLGAIAPEELKHLLQRHAFERWEQKVHFARLRVDRLGWGGACHQTALEILGYRFNRLPMLRIAATHPLEVWTVAGFDVEAVLAAEKKGWRWQGIRPANHPRRRLQQYARWVAARPDWPDRLRELAPTSPSVPAELATREVRRLLRFTELREQWADTLCGGVVGGTRLDNLICDGFLPLLAAGTSCGGRAIWMHWFPGDLPPLWVRALRQLDVFSGRLRPASHGVAQGLLGWLVAQERSEAISGGRGA